MEKVRKWRFNYFPNANLDILQNILIENNFHRLMKGALINRKKRIICIYFKQPQKKEFVLKSFKTLIIIRTLAKWENEKLRKFPLPSHYPPGFTFLPFLQELQLMEELKKPNMMDFQPILPTPTLLPLPDPYSYHYHHHYHYHHLHELNQIVMNQQQQIQLLSEAFYSQLQASKSHQQTQSSPQVEREPSPEVMKSNAENQPMREFMNNFGRFSSPPLSPNTKSTGNNADPVSTSSPSNKESIRGSLLKDEPNVLSTAPASQDTRMEEEEEQQKPKKVLRGRSRAQNAPEYLFWEVFGTRTRNKMKHATIRAVSPINFEYYSNILYKPSPKTPWNSFYQTNAQRIQLLTSNGKKIKLEELQKYVELGFNPLIIMELAEKPYLFSEVQTQLIEKLCEPQKESARELLKVLAPYFQYIEDYYGSNERYIDENRSLNKTNIIKKNI